MAKKEEVILNPEILDNSETPLLNTEVLEQLKEAMLNNDSTQAIGENDSDSFFRGVVNHLMDGEKNISTKTEYLTVNENFSGSKLAYLSRFANMPYLNEFIKIIEVKRVSLNRKSRQELIMAMEKREEEIANRRNNQLGNLLGMG